MRRSPYPGRTFALLGCMIALGVIAPAAPAAPHTVRITLVAGQSQANGGFNFDGYAKGAMAVTVPVGWKVEVAFENSAPLPHSLAVIPSRTAQPAGGVSGSPAFPGAATANLVGGLPRGSKTTLTFVASKPGRYEFACGVPGHAAAGMWETLIVSPTARRAVVRPAPAARVAGLSVQ